MTLCRIGFVTLFTISLFAGTAQAQTPPSVPTPTPAPPLPNAGPASPFRGGLHVQSMFHRAGRDAAAKRIVSIFRREGFPAVETHADGTVTARNGEGAVIAVTMPFRDGVHVVFACVHDHAPQAMQVCGRLKESLEKAGDVERVNGGEPAKVDDPKALTRRTFRWGVETRPASRVLKFAPPAGMLVLEKAGLVSTMAPNGMVLAGDETRAVALLMLPAANELNVSLVSVTTANDAAEATRLQNRALADWIKVLFE